MPGNSSREDSSIRLLIVDDHRMLREGLRRSMQDEGFDVVGEAANGESALDLTERLTPHVILMDVTMPGMGGVEATAAIRTKFPEVRVVMLTMHADHEVIAAAIKSGASGYLVKDCSTDEIAEAVRAAVDENSLLSPDLASSMLKQARALAEPTGDEAERVITKREEEVLQLIADGLSTGEVGEKLFISHKTVKNHLASIYHKLDARDRTQAVVQAVRKGIIRLD